MIENNREDTALLELLSEVRAGSESAFARLLSLYEPLLRKQVARFFAGEARESEDAYQEACLALHRAALRYEARQYITFGLFAGVCIENRLRTLYKSGRRGTSVASVGEEVLPLDEDLLSTDFVDPIEERERLEELLRIINAALSPYERKVFALYIQEIPIRDIAETLGRSEKSVRNAVTRLLAKLRDKFGR